eukprot:SAG31_NODE_3371_length_4353_cov_3.023507_3_plen_102_part_00
MISPSVPSPLGALHLFAEDPVATLTVFAFPVCELMSTRGRDLGKLQRASIGHYTVVEPQAQILADTKQKWEHRKPPKPFPATFVPLDPYNVSPPVAMTSLP